MFLHQFKYEFLNTIRQKETIFWMLCFPVILATFFKMAFGNLYEKEEIFTEIPVAVVTSDTNAESAETFKLVMDSLELFSPEYLSEDEALEKLKEGNVRGIINVSDELSLKVAANGMEPTIIKTFLEQYQAQRKIITDTAVNHPEKMDSVISAFSKEVNAVTSKQISSQNMDAYVQYFFNLIAMVSLFSVTSGVMTATSNQGNLSAIGARKCISPAHKLISTVAGLGSSFITQAICTVLSITYIMFILKVNMGDNYFMIYLSGILSPMAGTALGFFIGSIGRASEGAKVGIGTSFVMVLCFLSGLMVGNMKPLIEENIPIVNRINPAALISDLFYCLMIYDNYDRYIQTAASLLAMTVIFTAGGFLLTRRKKYASL